MWLARACMGRHVGAHDAARGYFCRHPWQTVQEASRADRLSKRAEKHEFRPSVSAGSSLRPAAYKMVDVYEVRRRCEAPAYQQRAATTWTPLRADNQYLKMTNTTSSYPLYIKNIPYGTSSRLQTLDICLPRPLSESPKDAVWLIYIHGGAWRDPLITASSISPTLSTLLASSAARTRTLAHIAGIASLDYRLSPYPQHPTAPSLTPVTSAPARHAGRNAVHPTHVRDCARALRWLRREYGVGATRDWVAVGHSCGATMAFQLLDGMHLSGREVDEDEAVAAAAAGGEHLAAVAPPVAIVGLAGLYNLPLLAENHADCRAYEEFLQGAFGSDESVWLRASPTELKARLGSEKWPRGRCVVLAASPNDELVEPMQRDVMEMALEEKGWVKGGQGRELVVLGVEGDHDGIWQDGKGVAKAIEVVIERLFGKESKEGQLF